MAARGDKEMDITDGWLNERSNILMEKKKNIPHGLSIVGNISVGHFRNEILNLSISICDFWINFTVSVIPGATSRMSCHLTGTCIFNGNLFKFSPTSVPGDLPGKPADISVFCIYIKSS